MDSTSIPAVTISAIGQHNDSEIQLNGWVQNKRENKGLAFIILRDGTGFCQCVASEQELGEDEFKKTKDLTLESSVRISGKVKKDERQIGGYELQVTGIEVIQIAQDYPISKKAHGVDFLLDKRHLWLRSKRQWAIMRVRNQVIYSIHNFFQSRGYVQMDAPIFTGNACEGTTNLFETDFFDQPAYLSQSGQLYGEAMAMAMGKIYTFGPTFRAEKSKTRRHLSEFWMIEPEMAFYNLEMTMDVIEDFLQSVIGDVLQNCSFELEVLERDVTKLKAALNPFVRLTYKDAVAILKGEKEVNGKRSIDLLTEDLNKAKDRLSELNNEIEETEAALKKGGIKKGKVVRMEQSLQNWRAEKAELEEAIRNIPVWIQSAENFVDGNDFGGSDETVITRMFDTPVMVFNWPKIIKAFYMKEVDEDPTLVKGVDVLAPEGYGEIVGGGERETDIDVLIDSIKKHDLPMSEFEWYLDLRRYGSVPHAGFGLGLERLITWICKIHHLREAIPFPRLMGRLLP
ncbi:asparagine--tRNA ligase [bacterium]|nr:asparagine--tRNA ligase [bacterium]